MIAARERILIHLDTWILPETADQRQALADAAGALAQAGRITAVGETVTRTVRRGCGSPAVLLVADGAETRAGGFSAPQARFAPLDRQTAIVHLLETAGGSSPRCRWCRCKRGCLRNRRREWLNSPGPET